MHFHHHDFILHDRFSHSSGGGKRERERDDRESTTFIHALIQDRILSIAHGKLFLEQK